MSLENAHDKIEGHLPNKRSPKPWSSGMDKELANHIGEVYNHFQNLNASDAAHLTSLYFDQVDWVCEDEEDYEEDEGEDLDS